MFDRTVTLFNYMKSTGKWYSTVIRNCTLEAHIQIPEECFEASGGNYYKWENWKRLY